MTANFARISRVPTRRKPKYERWQRLSIDPGIVGRLGTELNRFGDLVKPGLSKAEGHLPKQTFCQEGTPYSALRSLTATIC